MRELSIPAVGVVPDDADLTDDVVANDRERPAGVAFREKSADGSWSDITWSQFAAQVRAVANGLIGAGVRSGDRVALFCRTRYEWTLADYAIWTAGAVTVPIYDSSSAAQVAWILGDSGAVAVIAETGEHLATVEQVRESLADLRSVWGIDAGGLAELAENGKAVGDEQISDRRASRTADSLATIIYTSGTTGQPKGCELTHRNMVAEVIASTSGLGPLFDESQSTLLFLPLAHVFGRVIQCGCVHQRVRMGHTSDTTNLLADLAAFRPTFLLAVPRVFEKVYNGARQKAHDEGKGAIFDRAEHVAVAYSAALATGRPGAVLSAQHAVFDRLVYRKIRVAVGGRCHSAISGGGPLGARLGNFFCGIGLTIYEGYGLTESTAGTFLNLPSAIKVGTVGRPLAGIDVRIADDGEILLRGEPIFTRYWHDENASAQAITDGWLRTGDLGELDEDGFLTITGRKKEILVTAGGKNVAPAVLEDRLRAHPLVSQCMVVGDGRPYIGCLITVDRETLPAWLRRHGKPSETPPEVLCEDAELLAELEQAIAEANRAVSRAESIKRFRVLAEDFTEDNGQLTPTMKLRRTVVLDRYAEEVEALYRR